MILSISIPDESGVESLNEIHETTHYQEQVPSQSNYSEIKAESSTKHDDNGEPESLQEDNGQCDPSEHVRSQMNKKQFSCSLCSQHFSRKSHVTRHFNSVHKKLRPHSCKFCGKSYSTKRDCEIHVSRCDIQVSHVHEKENVEKSLILLSSQNSPQWQGSSTITAESSSKPDNYGEIKTQILCNYNHGEMLPEPQTQQENNGQGEYNLLQNHI